MQRDRARLRDIDYGGLGLIALGLGSLQIMLDRGEDYDWFSSPTIKLFGLLAGIGIVGGIAWLLLVEKPVVDCAALRTATSHGCRHGVWNWGDPLFQHALILVLAGAWFGDTVLLAVSSSSVAAVTILFTPIVARVVRRMFQAATREIVFGFWCWGCSAAFANHRTLQSEFLDPAMFRLFQYVGPASLVVPNRTLSKNSTLLVSSLNPYVGALVFDVRRFPARSYFVDHALVPKGSRCTEHIRQAT